MALKETFIQDSLKFIEEHKTEYGDKVLVKSAIMKTKSGYWLNCLTIYIILRKEENIKIKESIVYDNFVLFEDIIDLVDFKKIIEELWEPLKFKSYDVIFHGYTYTYEYLYNHNQFSEWPGLYFEIINIQDSNVIQELQSLDYPFVKYNVPCFINGYDAIKEWMNLENFRGQHDERLGRRLIFLPNYKARIKNIIYENEILNIFVEGVKNSLNNLDCQLVIKNESGIIRKNVLLNEKEGMVSLNLEGEPLQIYIQLVTKNGEKLDYYSETPFSHTGRIRFIRRNTNKDLIKKISNGENEQVEFKPFFNMGENKENEIIETIIAFSNSNAGSIIFGVNNHSEIEGIKPSLLKMGTVEIFLEKFQKHLRKIVSDKIDKGVSFNSAISKIGSSTVLEIKIPEGSDKPYFNVETNQTYIRKGSTNRHPNSEEIKLLVNEKK